jgi:hypothetical protein
LNPLLPLTYVTVAERPLNPTDFPNVPEEDLVPGSEIIQRIQAIGIYSILSNNSHKIGYQKGYQKGG